MGGVLIAAAIDRFQTGRPPSQINNEDPGAEND